MRQISTTRKRLAAGAFLIVAGPVALGSAAYACQSLATLHANPAAASAGSTVTLSGKNYGFATTGTQNSNIEIHLNTRTGPVIGTFAPVASRRLNGTVIIPAGTPAGDLTLVATQYTPTGNAVSGTPGRASVVVSVASRSTGQASAPAAAAATSSEPVAATPAQVTSAAATPAAVSREAAAPAAATASPSVAAPANAAAPAPGAVAVAEAATVAAATQTVTPALAAPDAAGPTAPTAAGSTEVNAGLLSATSDSSSNVLPGLTLAVGLALVVLSLGAFLKSGRNLFGGAPLA